MPSWRTRLGLPVLEPPPLADALAPNFIRTLSSSSRLQTSIDEQREPSCQKLLFSATLTRDPAQIAALNLRDPKYFVVQGQRDGGAGHETGVLDFVMEKFTMPASLSVSCMICNAPWHPTDILIGTHDHL